MADVWDKYVDMCKANGTVIPQMYISRRTTFYDAVRNKISVKGRFVRSLTNKKVLDFNNEETDHILAESLNKMNTTC